MGLLPLNHVSLCSGVTVMQHDDGFPRGSGKVVENIAFITLPVDLLNNPMFFFLSLVHSFEVPFAT